MNQSLLRELVSQVQAGRRRAAGWQMASWEAVEPDQRAVYSGSFAPRHAGHRALAAHARGRGWQLAHEISLTNVDKPPLSVDTAVARAAQFSDEPLWITDAPRFPDKAALFSGARLLVGLDTLRRIADARYYRGEADRRQAVDSLAAHGCRLIVYGRCNQHGVFQTLGDLTLPAGLRKLCEAVPEAEFRADISSTELRQRNE